MSNVLETFVDLNHCCHLLIALIVNLQVLPGLYVGNYRDSKDPQQLERHNITHIVAIHDCPRRLLPVSIYIFVCSSF